MTQNSDHTFLSEGKKGYRLNHGSLFSGIGGFDLASEWMGWNNAFHCEWNEFGQKILKHYWPKAIPYEDITKTDFTIWRGKIDILTGGFPCQPYSAAGKRLGKDDDRHLWPEMLRAIREIKPKYIVAENVSGLLSWNGGLVFNEVQADLEAEGYEVQPCVLPACAVNAPHRRDRIWFVAYANECTTEPSGTSGETQSNRSENNDEPKSGRKQTEQHTGCSNVHGIATNPNNPRTNEQSGINGNRQKENKGWKEQPQPEFGENGRNGIDTNTKSKPSERLQLEQREISEQKQREFGRNGSEVESKRNVADTERKRQQEQGKPNGQMRFESFGEREASWTYDDGRWPTQSPICSGNDGISRELDGITFSKWRQESIKAYGNAIVPQVAYQIFKALMITETKAREEKNIITVDMHKPLNETGT
jgi:DNA (cytosine-5)-methyltransferase 1